MALGLPSEHRWAGFSWLWGKASALQRGGECMLGCFHGGEGADPPSPPRAEEGLMSSSRQTCGCVAS